MPNLNAALICAQLEQIDRFLESKRFVNESYRELLANVDDIKLISERDGTTSNNWLNAIRLENEDAKMEFLEYTNSNGIMTRPCWKLNCDLPMYMNCLRGDLTISREAEKTIVNIPSSANL